MGRKTLKESLIWRRLSVEHLKKKTFSVSCAIFYYSIENQPASAVNPKKAIGAQQVKFVNTCKMITLVINQLLKIHAIELTITSRAILLATVISPLDAYLAACLVSLPNEK